MHVKVPAYSRAAELSLCEMLQKATQDARALAAVTRERDHLLQELAACNQKLAAADTRAAEQDANGAHKAAQMFQVALDSGHDI